MTSSPAGRHDVSNDETIGSRVFEGEHARTGAATAATACRAMAYQEGERAKHMENPTTRGPIESAARRYAALAERLEALRKEQAVGVSVRDL